MAAHEEPPYLIVGTEVSAKYRGAFCEAKVKKLIRLVKCKVTLKDGNSHLVVTDVDIKGPIKHGAMVEVRRPDTQEFVEATINKVTDCSTYTVVFDDGDENTLRRTQMCPKGEKHFIQSETLDQLPLTHPEHFGTPVMKPTKRRRKLTTGSESESEEDSEDEESPKRREYRGRTQELVGRVVCIELEDRKRSAWVPALVVDPNASDVELKTKDHFIVRAFKDSKYYAVTRRETKEFTREMSVNNEDKTLKNAFDKALAFFDSKELPSNWDKEEMLGSDTEVEEGESSDDEQSEEKDLFVAQLFKFMDDRGTPINKAPVIGGRDLNLYRLFKVVQNIGGYNRVTNQAKWRQVYTKMNLPPANTAANQVKAAYKKYLHAFEDFYRKLGSSMGTISRPGRNRHNSGRSLFSVRDRESPRSPRSDKKSKEEDMEEMETSLPEMKPQEENEASPRKSRTRANEEEKRLAREDQKPEKRVTREDMAKLSKEDAGKSTKDDEKKTPSKKMKEEPSRAMEFKKMEVEQKKELSKKEEPKKGKDVKKGDTELKVKADKIESEEQPSSAKKRVGPRSKSLKVEDDKKKETTSDETKIEEKDREAEDEEKDSKYEKKTRRREPEFSVGTKLKVKYGRGKEQKLYEAKIVEAEPEAGNLHYLVHYAGWNNRYDEWIMKDRIVEVVECPDKTSKSSSNTPSNKFAAVKKRMLKAATPGKPQDSTKVTGNTTSRPLGAAKAAIQVRTVGAAGKPIGTTPTRSLSGKSATGGSKPISVGGKPAAAGGRVIAVSGGKPAAVGGRVMAMSSGKPAAAGGRVMAVSGGKPAAVGGRVMAVSGKPASSGKPATTASKAVAAATKQSALPAKPTTASNKMSTKKLTGVSSTPSSTRTRMSRQNSLDPEPSPSRTRRTRRNSTVGDMADIESHVSDESESEDEDPIIEEKKPIKTSTEPAVPIDPPAVASAPSTPVAESEAEPEEEPMEVTVKGSSSGASMASVEEGDMEEMIPGLKESVEYIEELMAREEDMMDVNDGEALTAEPPDLMAAMNEILSDTEGASFEDFPDFTDPDKEPNSGAGTPNSTSSCRSRGKRKDLLKGKRKAGLSRQESVESPSPADNKLVEALPVKECIAPEVTESLSVSEGHITSQEESKDNKAKKLKVEKKAEKKVKAGEKKLKVEKIKDEVVEQVESSLDLELEKKADQEKKKGKKKVKKKVESAVKHEEEVKEESIEDEEKAPVLTEEVSVSQSVPEEAQPAAPQEVLPSAPLPVLEDSQPVLELPSCLEPPEVTITAKPSQPVEEEQPEVATVSPPVLIANAPLVSPSEPSSQPQEDTVPAAPAEEVTAPSSAPSTSTAPMALLDNTPPDTPENSPHHGNMTPPSQGDTDGEEEAAPLPEATSCDLSVAAGVGGESPGACDMSTISNSSSGSSGNMPSSESSNEASHSSSSKRKSEPEPPPVGSKRRKRNHKRANTGDKSKSGSKATPTASDSDEALSAEATVANAMAAMSASAPAAMPMVIAMNSPSPSKRTSSHLPSPPLPPMDRPSKYNFNLDEGKYLEGDARIEFILEKINEMRKIYMGLKAEVACIDRRRKRHRRKQKEGERRARSSPQNDDYQYD